MVILGRAYKHTEPTPLINCHTYYNNYLVAKFWVRFPRGAPPALSAALVNGQPLTHLAQLTVVCCKYTADTVNPQEISPSSNCQHNDWATQPCENCVYETREGFPTTVLWGYISKYMFSKLQSGLLAQGLLTSPKLVVKTALDCVHRDTARLASWYRNQDSVH